MTMTDHNKGVGPVSYSGRKAGRPGPRDVLTLIQRKCELRALLIEQQAKIDQALPYLDQAQTQELLSLMAAEAQSDVCKSSKRPSRLHKVFSPLTSGSRVRPQKH